MKKLIKQTLATVFICDNALVSTAVIVPAQTTPNKQTTESKQNKKKISQARKTPARQSKYSIKS
jgi:hypothetical protein